MSTRVLHLDSPKIDKATSGAYYLLFNNGGHTGNLVLDGSAYVNYINASGLAVQNGLVVTGSQTTHGNATFFSFNNSANLSVTGSAYINNLTGSTRFNDIHVTGDTVISGDIGHYGNFNSTGTTNITGSLYVNGVQITGVTTISYNVDFSLTGDAGAALTGRGDLLVGTGNSGVARFATGGARSGETMIYDPSQVVPFRWGTGAYAIQAERAPIVYERLFGASGVGMVTGDHHVAIITKAGLYKSLEGDVNSVGDFTFRAQALKNGSPVGNEMSAQNGSFFENYYYGKSSVSSISFSIGDAIGIRVIDDGSFEGAGNPATGQFRASIFFLPTGSS